MPAKGIQSQQLRRIRLQADFTEGLRAGNQYVRLFPEQVARIFRRAGFRRLKRGGRSQAGGRRGWPDETLLDAALFYVQQGGRRPVADLAAAWKLTPAQARDMLSAARRKGFLTAGVQGKTSRRLTDLAKDLLAKRSQP